MVKNEKKEKRKFKHRRCDGCDEGSVAYGLGFIGAAIYYISIATGFWQGVLSVLKAIV